MRKQALLTLFTLILCFSLPAFAQDQKPISHTPEFCEFTTTFPEDPYTTRRCEDPEKQERCYDQISFTKVFDLDATVNFRLICNKVDSDLYKEYSGEVMQSTLRAMTKRSVVQEFNTFFRDEDSYKQAGLVGEGKVGLTPTIYIAQLWMAENSALSVEAEIIGNAGEAADKLFSDVLRSIKYKKDPEPKDGKQQ